MLENNSIRSNHLGFSDYLGNVFAIMGAGLAISAGTALLCSGFVESLQSSNLFFFLVLASCIAEIVIAIRLSRHLYELSRQSCYYLYLAYAILTGFSLSNIFYIYTASSLWLSFAVCAIMFGCMALIGKNTKADLSKFSSLIAPALLAIVIVSLLNLFVFHSEMLDWIVSYAAILIFLGLIAYDVRKLQYLYEQGLYDAQMGEKIMIMGAFELYLNFINLFIRLVQLLGKRRRD